MRSVKGVLPGSFSARDRAAAIDVSSNGSARKAMRGSGDEQLHASREQLAFFFFFYLRLLACILEIVVLHTPPASLTCSFTLLQTKELKEILSPVKYEVHFKNRTSINFSYPPGFYSIYPKNNILSWCYTVLSAVLWYFTFSGFGAGPSPAWHLAK